MNEADKNFEDFEEAQKQLIELLKEETLKSIQQKIDNSEGEVKDLWKWVLSAKMYYDSRCPQCKGTKYIINTSHTCANDFLIVCPECNGAGKIEKGTTNND